MAGQHPLTKIGAVVLLFLTSFGPARAAQTNGPGYSLSFDGTNDYVVMTNDFSLNTYPFSATLWVKTTQVSLGSGLINKYVSASLNGWQIFLYSGAVRAWYFANPTSYVYDGSLGLNGGFVRDGSWHHVAFTVDASGGKIYRDGVLQQSLGWTGTPGPPTTTQKMRLGDYPASNPANDIFFKGELDEVQVWARALSQSEIQTNMNRSLKGNEANLISYYRLDEGSGGVARDTSQFGRNDGFLTNGPAWVSSTAPIGLPPSVTTQPATQVTGNSARLNGTVNPNGLAVVTWFEWDVAAIRSVYKRRTAPVLVAAGTALAPLSADINGLTAGILYHCRLVASNGLGIVRGPEASFWYPFTVSGADPITNECHAPPSLGVTASAAPVALAGGLNHSLALRADGTVTGWGANGQHQLDVPPGLNNAVAISAGSYHSLALTADGVVLAWGDNSYGQLAIGSFPAYAGIAAGYFHSVAVITNGRVACFGVGRTATSIGWEYGQSIAPAGLSNVVAVAAGFFHTLALRSDGTVVGWGAGMANTGVSPHYGQALIPAGLNDVVAIAAGGLHSLALKANGSVIAWGAGATGGGGYPNYGQANVPPLLSNVVSIAGGSYHSLALIAEGTVVPWGAIGGNFGQNNIPPLNIYAAIAAGQQHSLVLTPGGQVEAYGDNTYGQSTPPPGLNSLGLSVSGLNTNVVGIYQVGVTATNLNGPIGSVTRTVVIADTVSPVVTLNGPNSINAFIGSPFNDPGASATDSCAGDLTANIQATVFDTTAVGAYVRTYSVTDPNGNSATTTRTIDLYSPVQTDLPSDIMVTSATLHGQVNPNSHLTGVYFDYGFTTNYGNSTPVTLLGSSSFWNPISYTLTGLGTNTVYHYRVVATNAYGTIYGANVTFATPLLVDTGAGLPGVSDGSIAWGDFDNDGRMDLLLTGLTATGRISSVWRNLGNGTFTRIASLTGVFHGSGALGDYDNDGRLDVLLTGYSDSGVVSEVWRNLGNGSFTKVADLPGVEQGSAAWGDFDNDGRLDILLAGSSLGGPLTQVWRNTGHGFVNFNAGLPGLSRSSVAWGDSDNDGRLDILLAGSLNGDLSGGVVQVWRNTGGGFTNLNIGFTGVADASVAWGDYDNDGNLDILLSGNGGNGSPLTQVWRNTGNGFTNIGAGIIGRAEGSAAWGDFDNDGKLDILLAGNSDADFGGSIWRNTGSGFADIQAGLPQLLSLDAAWSDYDNDGRLDVAVAGQIGFGAPRVCQVLQAVRPAPSNAAPSAPTNLTAQVSNGVVILVWDAPVDDHTPAGALSYNLRVGTLPGAGNIVSPQADAAIGFRRLPALGNCQLGTNALLQRLRPGAYYWSVQAIDGAFAGGPFAVESTFSIPVPSLSASLLDSKVRLSWPSSASGDYLLEGTTLLTDNPSAWTTVLPPFVTNGATISLTVPALGAKGFYRLHWP